MKKVVLIGPESTGKTTLAAYLAEHFNTIWVPEYARAYLEGLERPYEERDLLEIAKGQLRTEDELAGKARDLLICDTDLIVLKVWGEHNYGRSHPWILEQIEKRKYDLYLLTYPDIPWVGDPQRENPELGEYFYGVFERELLTLKASTVEIRGLAEQRQQKATEAVQIILNPM